MPAPELATVLNAITAVHSERNTYATGVDSIRRQSAIYNPGRIESMLKEQSAATISKVAVQARKVGSVIGPGIQRMSTLQRTINENFQASWDVGRYQMQLAEVRASIDMTATPDTGFGVRTSWIEQAAALLDRATEIGDRYTIRAIRHEILPLVGSSRETGAVDLARKLRAAAAAEVPPELAQLGADYSEFKSSVGEFRTAAYEFESSIVPFCYGGRMGSQPSVIADALGDIVSPSEHGGILLDGVKHVPFEGGLIPADEVQPTAFQLLGELSLGLYA